MNHDHTTEHLNAKNPVGSRKKLIGAVIMLGLVLSFCSESTGRTSLAIGLTYSCWPAH